MSKNEFVADELVVDAVLRNLEIIGEAAGKIPDDVKENYPDISWRKMIGLRNIVIHEYFWSGCRYYMEDYYYKST